MRRGSMVLNSSNRRLFLGLSLALTLLLSFGLAFAAQAEAEAQAGDAKAKAAGSAAKARAKAQTSQVNVTTEGSGKTKITVNGQRVDNQGDGNQRAFQATQNLPNDIPAKINAKTITVDSPSGKTCEVDSAATIRIQDKATTPNSFTFTNGNNDVKITGGSQITIATEGGKDLPGDLQGGGGTVLNSSGVTCTDTAGASGSSSGGGASAGDAEANAGDLTCNQLVNIIQNAREDGEADTAQYIQYVEIAQNCDIQGGDVIAGSIPDGAELADTGGPSLLYGALALGLVLVGGGTLLLRSINR